ncbi:Uncharacterised protein [Streptococcus pneumoniae]|nr:Uncharacterised protein [Streptococcus pneumoniae]CRH97738.1 Uncharacterised protein [Streptococcus pneumoniae]
MCLELTIAFAIALRIPLIFSRVSGYSPAGIGCAFGASSFAAAGVASTAAGASVAATVCPPFANASMSAFTIRPFLPVPATL